MSAGSLHGPRSTPTEQDAETIVQNTLHEPVRFITRFQTGLCHYVYDILTASNTAVVVRIARSDAAATLTGAVYWSRLLRPLGVPLPRILHAELQPQSTPFPFLLLERLPGTDLGHVYPQLSQKEKRCIVKEVVHAQALVNGLSQGNGFGYALGYEAPFPHRTWTEVILASLARSRSRIAQGAVFDGAIVDRLHDKLPKFARYLDHVSPTPFLDDTTTKNVIVHDGRLSGIVDVDVVCFGDPIWTIGLTQMALLGSAYSRDYVEMWCDFAEMTAEQRNVLTLYTAIFCVDFMSEVGQAFNRDTPADIDQQKVRRLTRIFEDLMQAL